MSIEGQPLSGIRWVDRETLQANDYNPNHVAPIEMGLLKTSIMETGWTQPIVVLDDWSTIVDGFHRWTISGDPEVNAMTGGLVPVVSCGLDRNHQMMATIRHNRARGNHIIDRMGHIVRALQNEGCSDEEIQARLGMEQEEIERLSEVRGLPELTAKRENRKNLPDGVGESMTLNKAWYPDKSGVKKRERKST